jgi:hypothetical protein
MFYKLLLIGLAVYLPLNTRVTIYYKLQWVGSIEVYSWCISGTATGTTAVRSTPLANA